MGEKAPKSWEYIQELCNSSNNWASKRTRQFLDLVDKHFLSALDKPFEKFYPDQLGITSSGLRKNCKLIIGVSPSYCVQARVIFEARKMFEHDRKQKMVELALKLGLDEYHFSKLFKKHTGLKFSDYRKTVYPIN